MLNTDPRLCVPTLTVLGAVFSTDFILTRKVVLLLPRPNINSVGGRLLDRLYSDKESYFVATPVPTFTVLGAVFLTDFILTRTIVLLLPHVVERVVS